jgi:uncharacterized protein (DUF2147 family)
MKTTFLLLFSTLILHANSFANSGPDAILGEWISQEKDGKISIYKQGDKFYGKITWGKTPGKKDTNNPDPKLRTRDIVNTVILQISNSKVLVGKKEKFMTQNQVKHTIVF